MNKITIVRRPEDHAPDGVLVTCPAFSREYWFASVDSAHSVVRRPEPPAEQAFAASAALEWYKWN